jgi:hypothetical protein
MARAPVATEKRWHLPCVRCGWWFEDQGVDGEPEADQPGAAEDAELPQAARAAIWQLFEQGLLDENSATAGLLAVDIGLRRTGRGT